MKLLALSVDTVSLSYSLFNESVLQKYGMIKFSEYAQPKVLLELENGLRKLLKDNKVALCVMTQIDLNKNDKFKLKVESELRAVIKVECERQKVLFQELKFDGWLKKITNGTPTFKQKQKLLKKFGIKLKKSDNLLEDEKALADTILLGEASSRNMLQIGE